MIVKLQKLPKEFLRPRKEPNLLIYTNFKVLICTDKSGSVLGSVRTGIGTDDPQSGLITDLWVDNTGTQDLVLQGYYARLSKAAESNLRKMGVNRVDAYYLDGPGKLEHYYSCGYVPERRTVQIQWDLTKIQNSKIKMQNDNVKVKKCTEKGIEELSELHKNSFRPYWVAPHDFKGKTFFVAYKNNQAVGMIDEKLEMGIVIRKGFGGGGLGSALLNHALRALKKKGKKKATTLATSGLDDYDPQVYLYTMNGGKIKREYICLQKEL